MSYQNEEGSPLVAEEISSESARKERFSRSFLAILALSVLAFVAALGFLGGMKTLSSTVVTSLEAEEDEVKSTTVVSTDYSPYHYLKGKVLSFKIKTYQHGLDKYGEPVKNEKPFFSLVLSFFKIVQKVHNDKNDPTLVDSSFLLGAFKGLNADADLIFNQGDYCAAKQVSYSGIVEMVCGEKYECTGVYLKDPCSYRIVIAHPNQCGKKEIQMVDKADWKDLGPNLLIE